MQSKLICGASDMRYLAVMVKLGYNFFEQKLYEEAESTAQKMIRCAPGVQDNSKSADLMCNGLDILFLCLCQSGQCEAAENTMRQAMETNAKMFGWDDAETINMMLQLGTKLGDWGKPEKDSRLRAKRLEIVGNMDSRA
jgi:hypothetical protein